MASVCVLMGSKSDKGVLAESGFVEMLQQVLGPDDVEYSICSAHRNARELDKCVVKAQREGAKLFVGIAGMAAALPGALAGLSDMTLPVIAVPLDEHGIDSCIYMPPGVPVLTAGVGKTGLKNAAIAVCQILALDADEVMLNDRFNVYMGEAESKKPPEFGIDPLA